MDGGVGVVVGGSGVVVGGSDVVEGSVVGVVVVEGVSDGVGSPHCQLVNVKTKTRRQMPIADIVCFRIIVYLLSTRIGSIKSVSIYFSASLLSM